MEDVREKWYNTMERIAECMVCLNIPECFFVQCTNGHHVCMICRTKLLICPKCKELFLPTRNFLAEELIQELKQMKKELENTSKCKTKTVDVSTQTDSIIKIKICSATQTVDTPTRSDNSHFCLIGTCMFKSSYRGLIHHLANHHKDIFYEADPIQETFSEKCMINMSILPQFLDFAFSINGMGLFFFKIAIHIFGQLQISVQRVQNQNRPVPFHYDIMIANQIRRHGKVVPCNGKELNKQNSVLIHPQEMSRITKISRDKLFECMITIRKCFCDKAFAKRFV